MFSWVSFVEEELGRIDHCNLLNIVARRNKRLGQQTWKAAKAKCKPSVSRFWWENRKIVFRFLHCARISKLKCIKLPDQFYEGICFRRFRQLLNELKSSNSWQRPATSSIHCYRVRKKHWTLSRGKNTEFDKKSSNKQC